MSSRSMLSPIVAGDRTYYTPQNSPRPNIGQLSNGVSVSYDPMDSSLWSSGSEKANEIGKSQILTSSHTLKPTSDPSTPPGYSRKRKERPLSSDEGVESREVEVSDDISQPDESTPQPSKAKKSCLRVRGEGGNIKQARVSFTPSPPAVSPELEALEAECKAGWQVFSDKSKQLFEQVSAELAVKRQEVFRMSVNLPSNISINEGLRKKIQAKRLELKQMQSELTQIQEERNKFEAEKSSFIFEKAEQQIQLQKTLEMTERIEVLKAEIEERSLRLDLKEQGLAQYAEQVQNEQSNKFSELAQLDENFKKREISVAEREGTVQAQERAVAEREGTVQAQEREVAEQKNVLEAREREVTEQKSAVEAREREIAAKEEKLKEIFLNIQQLSIKLTPSNN
jgi:hypothetical protein